MFKMQWLQRQQKYQVPKLIDHELQIDDQEYNKHSL